MRGLRSGLEGRARDVPSTRTLSLLRTRTKKVPGTFFSRGKEKPSTDSVAMSVGSHPIPSRTRKLSLSEPMVLQGKPCGRVGRCRSYGSPVSKEAGLSSFEPSAVSGSVVVVVVGLGGVLVVGTGVVPALVLVAAAEAVAGTETETAPETTTITCTTPEPTPPPRTTTTPTPPPEPPSKSATSPSFVR